MYSDCVEVLPTFPEDLKKLPEFIKSLEVTDKVENRV